MTVQGSRVLVTGGLGFIGSSISMACAKAGAQVTILDAEIPGLGANRENIAGAEGLRVVAGDIRDPAVLKDVLPGQDVIFNCAAQTSHQGSMADPLLDLDINCRGQLALLEAFRKWSDQARLVFAGTTTQIGPAAGTATEESPEEPMDIYSANKSAGEKYHMLYHDLYGIRATSLRLPNVYGPRANLRSPAGGFVNYFVGLALQQKGLTVFGKGEQVRTLLFIDDAVQAFLKTAETEKTVGEVLMAGSEERRTIRQIAEEIVQAAGSGRVELVPWPKDYQGASIGDARIGQLKIRQLLGWQPTTGFAEGVREMIAYYRPRMSAYL